MEIKVNFFDVKSQCSVTRSFKDFSNSSQTGKLADHGVNWLSLNLGRLLHAGTFGERYLHVSRRDKPFSSITWRHWMMPMFVYWWREGFINATCRFDLKPQNKLNKWGVTGILQLTRGSSPFETANHNSKTFLRAYVCHPRTFWKKSPNFADRERTNKNDTSGPHIQDFAIRRSFPRHHDFKELGPLTTPSNRTLVTRLPSFSFHRKLNFYFFWVFTLEK